MFAHHILHYKNCIAQTKSNYYSNEGKSLFSLLLILLFTPLPLHLYSVEFCNSLMPFFNEKILRIHQNLGTCSLNATVVTELPPHHFPVIKLPPASAISELVHKSKSFTCQLHSLPSALVKACLPYLLPLYCCNHSLIAYFWNSSHFI